MGLENITFFGGRFEMRKQASTPNKEKDPAESTFEMDLDEVIHSLEEAAKEIEKVDWEHGGMTGTDR